MDNLEVWEKIFQENEWGKYPPVPLIRFIAKNFYKAADKKAVKILEIGSGTGANLWFCAREGFSVYALEGSQSAMQKMLERFNEENLSDAILGTEVGDYFEKLDLLKDNSFDAVIDVESLYCNHFSKSKEIVQKAFAKLKPGGVMFSMTFAEGTWGLEGEECDYHALIPTEGPMGGKGFTRYTTKEDIEKLYKFPNNKITDIQRQELHLDDSKVIKEWIVELQKF